MLAVKAAAAIGAEIQGYVIAGLHTRDALADGFHNAGAFMAQDDWQGKVGLPLHHMPIAMADACCRNLDEDFAGFRRFQIDRFDAKRCVRFR